MKLQWLRGEATSKELVLTRIREFLHPATDIEQLVIESIASLDPVVYDATALNTEEFMQHAL